MSKRKDINYRKFIKDDMRRADIRAANMVAEIQESMANKIISRFADNLVAPMIVRSIDELEKEKRL